MPGIVRPRQGLIPGADGANRRGNARQDGEFVGGQRSNGFDMYLDLLTMQTPRIGMSQDRYSVRLRARVPNWRYEPTPELCGKLIAKELKDARHDCLSL